MKKLLTSIILSSFLITTPLFGRGLSSVIKNRPLYIQEWKKSLNYSYEYDNPCYCPNKKNIINSDPNRFDYYQSPDETRTRKKGDCEDLSIELYDRLIKDGFKPRIVLGKVNDDSDLSDMYHVWLELDTEKSMVILDPTFRVYGTPEHLKEKNNLKYLKTIPSSPEVKKYFDDMEKILKNMFKK